MLCERVNQAPKARKLPAKLTPRKTKLKNLALMEVVGFGTHLATVTSS